MSMGTAREQVLPYSFASRHADALERVVEGFLAGAKSESSGGDRYLINIHTEVDTLRADGGEPSISPYPMEPSFHPAPTRVSAGTP